MIWYFLMCCLLGHSFVIGIEAKCLRSTGHMWQLKPPADKASCNRPPLMPRNATANEKAASTSVDVAASTAVDVAAATIGTPSGGREVGEAVTTPPAVILANYVYECASRRTFSSCSKQPEPESKPEFESGPKPMVPKPRTATLAVGELEGFRPTG
ncbi:uncharacterized protein LOC128252109 isoform X2 [Drosophila gunungcola]|uniref:uncharacterized protein LOC128252109 isoform X2 n=1 Tax=Drosophila gunungcola TaxID=103775 RepID=UPI0022E6F01F|nr:uncharacterized protein LOC128252109 isoform X2 [Drosophila gunungcola]